MRLKFDKFWGVDFTPLFITYHLSNCDKCLIRKANDFIKIYLDCTNQPYFTIGGECGYFYAN
ncbi:unknown [[Mannheimia] succiniciproducens MBEL55E]|uniref:Uncharacterized protein n=1 Tax=Mannheimia succiniciproducens (strain KCTC 0769BP / MBEL55E) TaxID=221988 RepID=Q65QN4_MANSM|nr:unknown [[Mannheimia] succiniciproducens MBEL55E]